MVELKLHGFDQLVDVRVHLLHRLDIMLVLDLDCLFEFNLQLILVFDDLLASCDLNFNVLKTPISRCEILHRQVLCSPLFLRALASSNRSQRSSCAM